MEAVFCDTNCTQGTNGAWSGCSGGCFCVHVGDSTEGRCITLSGYFDHTSPGAEV
ncbi:unnamed protein product [Ixodes pacificus]